MHGITSTRRMSAELRNKSVFRRSSTVEAIDKSKKLLPSESSRNPMAHVRMAQANRRRESVQPSKGIIQQNRNPRTQTIKIVPEKVTQTTNSGRPKSGKEIRSEERIQNYVSQARVRSAPTYKKKNSFNLDGFEQPEATKFLKIASLIEKNVFGLRDRFGVEFNPICGGEIHLLSQGAECIIISKKFLEEKIQRCRMNHRQMKEPSNLNTQFITTKIKQNETCSKDKLLLAIKQEQQWNRYKKGLVKDIVRRKNQK